MSKPVYRVVQSILRLENGDLLIVLAPCNHSIRVKPDFFRYKRHDLMRCPTCEAALDNPPTKGGPAA